MKRAQSEAIINSAENPAEKKFIRVIDNGRHLQFKNIFISISLIQLGQSSIFPLPPKAILSMLLKADLVMKMKTLPSTGSNLDMLSRGGLKSSKI